MTSTAGFHENLVETKTKHLNVPPWSGELVPLKGSPAQVRYATSLRAQKMGEWKARLPENVYKALAGIADSTWWFANQKSAADTIRYPSSWVEDSEDTSIPPSGNTEQVREQLKRSNTLVQATLGVTDEASPDIEEFNRFARKACLSPELSYLAMMALLYRQTRSQQVLALFNEARNNVQKHLEAIDKIVGKQGS